MEHVRWQLAMHNHCAILKHLDGDADASGEPEPGGGGGGLTPRTYFHHGDATGAVTFDPFTHVYMFDIGFPPFLFDQLAEMFNTCASAEYLISCVQTNPNQQKEKISTYHFSSRLNLSFVARSLRRRVAPRLVFSPAEDPSRRCPRPSFRRHPCPCLAVEWTPTKGQVVTSCRRASPPPRRHACARYQPPRRIIDQ